MRITCPICMGRFWIDPKGGKCPLCADNKFVDDEMVCECGRPVTRVVNKTLICNFLCCEQRALKKDASKTIEVKAVEVNDSHQNWYTGDVY